MNAILVSDLVYFLILLPVANLQNIIGTYLFLFTNIWVICNKYCINLIVPLHFLLKCPYQPMKVNSRVFVCWECAFLSF